MKIAPELLLEECKDMAFTIRMLQKHIENLKEENRKLSSRLAEAVADDRT